MNTIKNQPVAYDYHGDTPLQVPFDQIKPQDIHIYLDLNTKTGAKTCGQNCNHCWFVNYEKVFNKEFDVIEGQKIKAALDDQGYKVFARYTDSFAYNGDFMRLYGPAHNREFRQDQDHKPTKTMVKGDAWTSGRPLLSDNYRELLDLAHDSGYGTVSITFHGILDESLELIDDKNYPIKGTFSGANTVKVIRRIDEYNELHRKSPTTQEDRFRVNIGITVGKHNHTRAALVRYAMFFNQLGVETVRFNNFTDHGSRHPHLQLSDEEVAQVYKDLKWLHENVELKFQLAVSEDFGTPGVEVMNFPAHVGMCQAGRHLFTVIPTANAIISETNSYNEEKIGDIVACVNIFEPYLGLLVRKTNLADQSVQYTLNFDQAAIHELARKRIEGVYKNGCFAKELRKEKHIELSRLAKLAIKRQQPLLSLESHKSESEHSVGGVK